MMAPGMPPTHSQQGDAGTCTAHSLGKTICAAGEKHVPRINFIQDETINQAILLGKERIIQDGAWPVDGKGDSVWHGKSFLLKENGVSAGESTDKTYDVKLDIKELQDNAQYDPVNKEYILVVKTDRCTFLKTPEKGLHCVYIESRESDFWHCLNSWGTQVDTIPIHVSTVGNKVYEVNVRFRDMSTGTTGNSPVQTPNNYNSISVDDKADNTPEETTEDEEDVGDVTGMATLVVREDDQTVSPSESLIQGRTMVITGVTENQGNTMYDLGDLRIGDSNLQAEGDLVLGNQIIDQSTHHHHDYRTIIYAHAENFELPSAEKRKDIAEEETIKTDDDTEAFGENFKRKTSTGSLKRRSSDAQVVYANLDSSRKSEDQKSELRKYLSTSEGQEWMKTLENHINRYKIGILIAVTGDSGSGKSTFINTIRDLEWNDPDAAATDVIQSTFEIASFPFLNNENALLFDLPGVGTDHFPRKTYVKRVNLERFDALVIMTSQRFTENDAWLIGECKKFGKPYFMVRTQVDVDVTKKQQQNMNREQTIQKLRSSAKDFTMRHKLEEDVYIISGYRVYKNEYDFPKLELDLVDSLPEIKRTSLLHSMAATKENLKHKKKMLEEDIWYKVFLRQNDKEEKVVADEVCIQRNALSLTGNDIKKYYGIYKKQISSDIKTFSDFLKKLEGDDLKEFLSYKEGRENSLGKIEWTPAIWIKTMWEGRQLCDVEYKEESSKMEEDFLKKFQKEAAIKKNFTIFMRKADPQEKKDVIQRKMRLCHVLDCNIKIAERMLNFF